MCTATNETNETSEVPNTTLDTLPVQVCEACSDIIASGYTDLIDDTQTHLQRCARINNELLPAGAYWLDKVTHDGDEHGRRCASCGAMEAQHTAHYAQPRVCLSDDVRDEVRALLVTMEVDTPLSVTGSCQCEGEGNGDECSCDAMCLTVACNEHGTQWDYQTGDNSYTGGCYGLAHWAVVHVEDNEESRSEAVESVLGQLDSVLAGW